MNDNLSRFSSNSAIDHLWDEVNHVLRIVHRFESIGYAVCIQIGLRTLGWGFPNSPDLGIGLYQNFLCGFNFK